MSDLISRQAAIEAIEEYADRLQMVDWKENPGVPYKAYALNWCINTIRDLPSAQPERKQGEWVLQSDDYYEYYECDQCGIAVGLDDVRNYCPNCGAMNIELRKEE